MRRPFSSSALQSLILTLSLIPACGGGSTGGSPDASAADAGAATVPAAVAPFVGRWAFASGTETVTCGIDPAVSSVPGDHIVISPGPVPQTISVDDDGCVLTYNVTATVASSPIGGSCGGSLVETTIEAQAGGLLHFSGVRGIDRGDQHCTVGVDGYLARL